MKTINENLRYLFSQPNENRGIEWLKCALKTAIQLELSTIPIYLTAAWTINNDAYNIILKIAVEEMFHLAYAANLLAAVGETPDFTQLVPKYPHPLQGNVHEGVSVSLQALTKPLIATFMTIEYPEFSHRPLSLVGVPTIGAFYNSIQDVFKTLELPLNTQKQVIFAKFKPVDTNESANKLIDLIKAQGEGTRGSIEETADSPAHYYLFKQFLDQKKYRKNEGNKWIQDIPFPFPEIINMGEIPEGGYKQEELDPVTWQALLNFDKEYTHIINNLQSTWSTGGDFDLSDIKDGMSNLTVSARNILQIKIPNSELYYGPCFRYLGLKVDDTLVAGGVSGGG